MSNNGHRHRFYEALQVAGDALEEAGCTPGALADDGEIVIAALDRGFVLVGRWYQTGSRVEMRDAHIVRRWGTQHGLAQLAEGGPTGDTVLDAKGTVRFREPRSLPLWVCRAGEWEGRL